MTDDQAAQAQEAPPALAYETLDDFVRRFLCPTFQRRIDARTRVWPAKWWSSAETLIRLEALWRSFEHLRQDGATGISVWLRDHLDHHLAVLMDPTGPNAGADSPADVNTASDRHLPYLPPPEGLFDPDEDL